MAAAAIGRMSSLSSQENSENPPNQTKDQLIQALNIYYNIMRKHKPEPGPHVFEGMEPLDSNMNIKQLLFAARGLLTEIPLRRIWLMVQYPSMVEYAECLLRDEEQDLIRAKQIAEELLESAGTRLEMAQVLHMLVVFGSKANDANRFKLESMLIDELTPPEDKFFQSLHEHECWHGMKTMDSWRNMTEAYKSKLDGMDSFELYEALLMAAEHAHWNMFYDCARKGARLTGPPAKDQEPKATGTAPDTTVSEESESSKIPLGPSPLHVALTTGVFSLLELAGEVDIDNEMVKSVDHAGTPLLHIAALYDKSNAENVEFLMQRGANVNVRDLNGLTILQHLVNKAVKKLGLNTPKIKIEVPENLSAKTEETVFNEFERLRATQAATHINMIATLIKEAVKRDQEIDWTAGDAGWTVLHVLCAVGAHQHIMTCVNHGADPKDLRQDLTLIDTVVMQDRLSASLKIDTLDVLLNVVKLGSFHIKIIKHRVHHDTDQTTPRDETYRYPLLHLLSSKRGVSFEILKLLYRGNALWLEELEDTMTKLGLKWSLPNLVSKSDPTSAVDRPVCTY